VIIRTPAVLSPVVASAAGPPTTPRDIGTTRADSWPSKAPVTLRNSHDANAVAHHGRTVISSNHHGTLLHRSAVSRRPQDTVLQAKSFQLARPAFTSSARRHRPAPPPKAPTAQNPFRPSRPLSPILDQANGNGQSSPTGDAEIKRPLTSTNFGDFLSISPLARASSCPAHTRFPGATMLSPLGT